jgi:long-chain acyl-CoA synthetase
VNLILRGGQNIYPEELERVLQEHPDVVEAAVVGRDDHVLGQVPVALVVTRNAVSTAALVAHCRANLQPAKIPHQFLRLDSLPKTAAGKLHRAALPALLGEASQAVRPEEGR